MNRINPQQARQDRKSEHSLRTVPDYYCSELFSLATVLSMMEYARTLSWVITIRCKAKVIKHTAESSIQTPSCLSPTTEIRFVGLYTTLLHQLSKSHRSILA